MKHAMKKTFGVVAVSAAFLSAGGGVAAADNGGSFVNKTIGGVVKQASALPLGTATKGLVPTDMKKGKHRQSPAKRSTPLSSSPRTMPIKGSPTPNPRDVVGRIPVLGPFLASKVPSQLR